MASIQFIFGYIYSHNTHNLHKIPVCEVMVQQGQLKVEGVNVEE